jgi:hypothetical protein
MRPLYLLLSLLAVGCATQQPVARKLSAPTVTKSEDDPHVVVTRYELGSYRYPRETSASVEPAVFRSTRISGEATSTGLDARLTHAPASFDPLPASVELSAELSAQRDITDRIRAAQEVIVGLEKQVRAQYGVLVTQTDETMQLRNKLEAERASVRQLEAELRDQSHSVSDSPSVAQTSVQNSNSGQEVKW